MLNKRDNHDLKKDKNLKKRRQFENKSENTSPTGRFHLDRRVTKYNKEEL